MLDIDIDTNPIILGKKKGHIRVLSVLVTNDDI